MGYTHAHELPVLQLLLLLLLLVPLLGALCCPLPLDHRRYHLHSGVCASYTNTNIERLVSLKRVERLAPLPVHAVVAASYYG